MATERVEEHYHGDGTGGSSLSGAALVILFAVLIIALFFIFGGTRLFQGGTTNAPSISVPEQVDVNVEGGAGGQ